MLKRALWVGGESGAQEPSGCSAAINRSRERSLLAGVGALRYGAVGVVGLKGSDGCDEGNFGTCGACARRVGRRNLRCLRGWTRFGRTTVKLDPREWGRGCEEWGCMEIRWGRAGRPVLWCLEPGGCVPAGGSEGWGESVWICELRSRGCIVVVVGDEMFRLG